MQPLSNQSYVPATNGWSSSQKSLAIFFLILMEILALFFNSVIIITTLMNREVRKRSDALLVANLAVSDILIACFVMPFSPDVILHGHIRFSAAVAEFIGFANFLFCIASIVNLTILAIDQWLAIQWPLKSISFRPTSFPKCSVGFVWFFSTCCAILPLFGISAYCCFIPNTGPCLDVQWAGSSDAVLYTILVTVSSWGLGVIILVLAYTQIFLVVLKQRKAIKQTMVHKADCDLNRAKVVRDISRLFVNNSTVCCEEDCRGINQCLTTINTDMNNRCLVIGSTGISRHLVQNSPLSTEVDIPGTIQNQASAIYPLDLENSKTCAFGNCSRHADSCHADSTGSKETKAKSVCTSGKTTTRFRKIRCSCIPDTKPAVSLLLVVLTYFISWTPFCVVLLIEISLKAKMYDQLSLIFLWIGHASSVFNPLLYFFRFRYFRKATLKLCRKRGS